MTRDIRLAFEHPEARAQATALDAVLLDRISLRDHVVTVEIGAFQAERDTTQRISFDVVVEVAPLTGAIDDDVDRILSYDRVTEAIAFELAAERLNLLETLADRVAERILKEPQAQRVFLRIQKLDRGPGALGVEIMRARTAQVDEVTASAADTPHPRVAFLAGAASEALATSIDTLTSDDKPLILCVDYPKLKRPETDSAAAQRRIDLLALEQSAWATAAQDERCAVVGTRTELDWAMRNGQTCVWAPSKLVMDAVDGPRDSDALTLAAWLAAQLQAVELVTIGTPPPPADVPVRQLRLEGPEGTE